MNRISTPFAAMVLPLFLLGCATGNVKVSQPAAESASGIVIRIPSPCVPLMPCANATLTFARLQDDGSVISDEIYRASIVRSDHHYLLNAKPGKYAAVAVAYERGMRTGASLGGGVTVTTSRVFGENILFSEELVRQTLVEVTPGTIAVMGAYDFAVEGRMALAPSATQFMKDADPVQLHYAKALDPQMQSRGATSAIKFYRARFESAQKDSATRQALLKSAERHVGAEGWDKHIMRATQ
jgi:hypothetical protein